MQANRETVALFQAIAEGAGYEGWLKIRDKLFEKGIPFVDPFANGTEEQRNKLHDPKAWHSPNLWHGSSLDEVREYLRQGGVKP